MTPTDDDPIPNRFTAFYTGQTRQSSGPTASITAQAPPSVEHYVANRILGLMKSRYPHTPEGALHNLRSFILNPLPIAAERGEIPHHVPDIAACWTAAFKVAQQIIDSATDKPEHYEQQVDLLAKQLLGIPNTGAFTTIAGAQQACQVWEQSAMGHGARRP